jgi:hypothetical protein
MRNEIDNVGHQRYECCDRIQATLVDDERQTRLRGTDLKSRHHELDGGA